MNNNLSLEELEKILNLTPLVKEGGLIGQPYVSDEFVKDGDFINRIGERPVCATIYYVLTNNSFSHMHKLVSDEIWYYHTGQPLKMLLIDEDGHSHIEYLGMDLKSGQRPQITVRRNTYQGSCLASQGEYGLYSTSMAPRYMDQDYTEGTYEELEKYVCDNDKELLRFLTGKPIYR